MAERKYKCPECGGMNTKDSSITHNKRQYCLKCYELLEKRKKEREYLLKYICYLYRLNENQKMDGRILKDLKELMEEGHSYQEIYLTLKYCAEVKKLTFDVKYALGCVRYYKNECMVYLKNLKAKTDNSESLKPLQVITVKAATKKAIPTLSKKIIDISVL